MTTDSLFNTVTSKTGWYTALGFSKQYASNLKSDFRNGKLSEEKQKEILILLGYKVKTPMIWDVVA